MAMMNGRELNRAERFEDEKRRIIESCFGKKDDDGSVLETYITHIRITEYSTSPTAPPPPQARTPQAQKDRVIIVAVRKSGRVRMHKSKENPNGTFSIGKTWNLDDLSAIASYSSPSTTPSFREWAGDVGFTVTLIKPYYWQAQTDKEKKFFIASLVKIYGKYTGGRTPSLTGFDERELEQILEGAVAPRPGPRDGGRDRIPPARPSPVDTPVSAASVSSAYNSSMNAQMQASTTSDRVPSRGGLMANGNSSPARSADSGRRSNDLPPQRSDYSLRPDQSSLRRVATNNRSQDSVATSLAARSDDSAFRPRSRNGIEQRSTPEPVPAPYVEEKPVFQRVPDRVPERIPVPERVPERMPERKPDRMPERKPPPERKRPPMDPLRPQTADRDLVPAPLMSPGMRREPVVPPRSMERASPRKNSISRRPEPPTPPTDRNAVPEEANKVEAPASLPSPSGGTPVSINSAISPPPTTDTPAESPVEPPEETRPGLGPMIRAKKSRGEIAGTLWKAASAVSAFKSTTAFKPRPGGAADRMRQNANKTSDGPDGITSVVPAPPPPPAPAPEPVAVPEPPPKAADRTSGTPVIPEVKVTVPNANRPSSLQASLAEVKKPEEAAQKTEARKSIVIGNDVKYLATLGIDPTMLDKRSTEFAKWLDHFGFVPGDQMRAKNFDEMKVDLERELNKAQAGGWLARFQEEDERVDAIKRGLDLAMNECDEMDNLLTLYSVELSTLADDIAYIEAQGQGLQVQASNQKLLKKELESLLETCAISAADLDALKMAPLDNANGIEEIETSLVTLYKAMIKIDPSLGNAEARKSEDDTTEHSAGLNSDYGKMRIVQEKKEMYMAESSMFMRRLVAFMAGQIDEAMRATRAALDGALSKKVDSRHHDAGRDLLWMYSPLILYARDVDLDNWNRIVQVYQDKCQPVYKEEFREVMSAWKKNARKATGDEAELLFTSLQEKKEESIATTARKLTVKRSQTLAKTLRSPLGDRSQVNLEKPVDTRALPYEVFAGVMDDLMPLVQMEQNFIVDFFHATTLEQTDFPEQVALTRPRDRRGGDLKRPRLMEPDRDLARRVTRAMEVVFVFLEANLQQLIDFVLGIDPLQGVGVLATLERKLADYSQTNQDFLNTVLQKLHGNLEGRFKKFVDDQVRAIEETKVKIKKRKGVIGFMRIFPQFLTAVETMLAGVDPSLAIRRTVDREYARILKSMFDSLKVIARENPTTMGALGVVATGSVNSADPEDKEALNFHILLIENMNHFLEEVVPENNGAGALDVLDDWRQQAQREMAEHVGLYLNAVMRRPLGKLLEHLENIEAQLAGGKLPATVAAQPSNSKATFNKVLGGYDAKEVRKGIETLRKRVEKHFGGDGEDDHASIASGFTGGSGASRSSTPLVNRVLRECEAFYGDVEMRIGKIVTDVYGGDVLFEWPRAEVRATFGGR